MSAQKKNKKQTNKYPRFIDRIDFARLHGFHVMSSMLQSIVFNVSDVRAC